MTTVGNKATTRIIVGVLAGLLIGMIWIAGNAGVAHAQCGADIAVGSSVQGELWGGSCDYYFYGQAGTRVTIRMTALSPSLDPYLELYSPTGYFLTSNDDYGGTYNSLITYYVRSPGWYMIHAGAYSGSGSFELAVQRY